MKKILNILIPIKLNLNILQLEEYKYIRFIHWILKNFLKRSLSNKKTLVYTQKVKNILIVFFILCLAIPLLTLSLTKALSISIIVFIILITQPYVALGLTLLIIKPYEIYNKYKIINNTREKIVSLKNLTVIAVAGSFAKTSTKEILYQLLKTKYKTLRTPESFNTIFGIAKVIDLELDSSYKYFICEMAAYNIGEIKALTSMVPPKYGILTGITTQHFERFGSLINTIKAKFELVDAIKNKGNIIFNPEDQNIIGELEKRKIKVPNKNVSAKNIKFSNKGSSFYLIINQKSYPITTSLFGSANIKNITLASSMALKLGIPPKEIIFQIKNLKPADSRLALINFKKSTIVNNTYSSNIQSFKETISTAKNVKGKKVLVTPGIVELGKLEKEAHETLGKETRGTFDKVILVGNTQRAQSFAKGLKNNFEFIEDNRESYFKKIEELKENFDWIFLENDVTQNY